jgi:hypothetical protein
MMTYFPNVSVNVNHFRERTLTGGQGYPHSRSVVAPIRERANKLDLA